MRHEGFDRGPCRYDISSQFPSTSLVWPRPISLSNKWNPKEQNYSSFDIQKKGFICYKMGAWSTLYVLTYVWLYYSRQSFVVTSFCTLNERLRRDILSKRYKPEPLESQRHRGKSLRIFEFWYRWLSRFYTKRKK